VSTSTGDGYWKVAGDGGVFTYGAAQFHGKSCVGVSGQKIAHPEYFCNGRTAPPVHSSGSDDAVRTVGCVSLTSHSRRAWEASACRDSACLRRSARALSSGTGERRVERYEYDGRASPSKRNCPIALAGLPAGVSEVVNATAQPLASADQMTTRMDRNMPVYVQYFWT
jgi:hypothetical protein